MPDSEFDRDLESAALHVMRLSRDVPIDNAHKAQLRQELLRRHQELTAGSTQRAAFKLWPRLSGLKRLTLVAPPALAGALALSALIWGLQISGHQHPQTAEAARITAALARTAPSVTSWQWTLQVTGSNRPKVIQKQFVLQPDQHIDVQTGRALFYVNGRWQQLTADTVHNPGLTDWNVAFAVLAVQMSRQHFTSLSTRTVDGHQTEGVRYDTPEPGNTTVQTSFWVEPSTGLVFHVDRVKIVAGHVEERDSVDYHYGRS